MPLPLLCDRSRCRKPARGYKVIVPIRFDAGPPTVFLGRLVQACGGGAAHAYTRLCARHADRLGRLTRCTVKTL